MPFVHVIVHVLPFPELGTVYIAATGLAWDPDLTGQTDKWSYK